MKQTYIIEHLEPKLFDWCLIEYKHISNLVGKNNLWFTNIRNKKERNKLRKLKLGLVFKESIKNIIKKLKAPCILDPESNKTLNPKESKEFNYFIFGGILGDYPPKKRTKKELTNILKKETKGIQTRNIGKEQMSTDNAVYTVFQIAKKNKKLKDLKFKNKISIKINDIESVELPYKYNLIKIKRKGKVEEKPFMSKEIINYLKNKKGF